MTKTKSPVAALGYELCDEHGACAALGISRPTLWRGISEGRYPRPLRVGPNCNRWRVSELVDFLDRAAAARETVVVA